MIEMETVVSKQFGVEELELQLLVMKTLKHPEMEKLFLLVMKALKYLEMERLRLMLMKACGKQLKIEGLLLMVMEEDWKLFEFAFWLGNAMLAEDELVLPSEIVNVPWFHFAQVPDLVLKEVVLVLSQETGLVDSKYLVRYRKF